MPLGPRGPPPTQGGARVDAAPPSQLLVDPLPVEPSPGVEEPGWPRRPRRRLNRALALHVIADRLERLP
jgi:hypothetical protein